VASVTTVSVLVAHPDDELLGVGGTIRRHVEAGDQVTVHIEVTEGLRGDGFSRLAAARAIADSVGYRLSLGDSYQLAGRVPDLDHLSADIIYTHHPHDLNRDHRAVAEAALVAGRFAQSVRTFETPSSTEWALLPFQPNLFVGIDIYAKLDLLETHYADELRPEPHPRSGYIVAALARQRGSVAGLDAAEAFHVIRDAWR
jgi:N-acetylglucosamine malate deacetylase 1